MRTQLEPTIYKGPDRLNFLCIIATEMLGENTLINLPKLLAGYESVLSTLPSDIQQALTNIRLLNFAPSTLREFSLMIEKYQDHHRLREIRKNSGEDVSDTIDQRYVVNDNFTIRPMWSKFAPPDVREALRSLSNPLPIVFRGQLDLHEPVLPAEINRDDGYSSYIRPLGFLPPEPSRYPTERIGRAPGKIYWQDLLEIARQFDHIDVEVGRQKAGEQSWFNRLHDIKGNPTAELLKTDKTGLLPTDSIDLSGLKHLIGLPGAGKTTLLYLLAAYMYGNDYRACFLFPSIEVATGFIEILDRYGIDVALLSGQAKTSRARHALNFATALSNDNGGFGVTRPAAKYFSTNCALAGFTSDEETPFPHENPPCQEVMQGTAGHRRRKRQCALSSVCGYQYAERELGQAKLWAGHILSLDRKVSKLYCEEELHQFEYLARTFDLLVVDECDGAQSNLDERGTPIMKLVGDLESLWSTLLLDIHQPAAGGRNAFFSKDSYPRLIEMTGRFGRATERLLGRISHLEKEISKENANKLHTANSILWEMFADENDPDITTRNNARFGIETLWDTAIKHVAFRNMPDFEDEDAFVELETVFKKASVLMGSSVPEIEQFYARLLEKLDIWERDGNDHAVRALAEVLRQTPNLSSPLGVEYFFSYTGFLVSVSLVVILHFGLAPHLRVMNAQGYVRDTAFISRASRNLSSILPEALVGRLSGIRYSISEEGNIDISHVSFEGTPRMLPQRMTQLGKERDGAMAVLLTSATSMLENSPTYHLATGPDYVLRRPNAGDGWKKSVYTYLPMKDPQTGKPLRFSGAQLSRRDTILTTIVDELLKGDDFSKVSNAIAQNDMVDGVGRKAAFVVNSYDQCKVIYEHIHNNYSQWRGRVRYLSRALIHGTLDEHAVTASEVESLGHDTSWDLLIFPMSAIGRGVNIVYQFGVRQNKAMIGSLFFLTRPHPRGDSLQLIQGLVGKATEEFDRSSFKDTKAALDSLKIASKDAYNMVEYLLRMPLVSQRLGDYAEPFVANQIIIILQTIGRAMRGDCPAFVYFVDAAWAPNSALDMADDKTSSMLVMMQSILKRCLHHPVPAMRECYENLYQTFYEPLSQIGNLITEESI